MPRDLPVSAVLYRDHGRAGEEPRSQKKRLAWVR